MARKSDKNAEGCVLTPAGAGPLEEVRYELFASDVSEVQGGVPHTIDRENCLVFESGMHLYISWTAVPVQYCVGVAETSFFNTPPEAVLVMTKDDTWRDLIGCQVTLQYLDDDRQVLKLGTPEHQVFLSSHEKEIWAHDVVTVSRDCPTIPEF